MRLSLEWCLGIVGTAVFIAVAQYLTVGRLVEEVKDLRIEVKSGNSAYTVLAGEMAIMKFRMGTFESDIKVLKDRKP